MVKIMEQSLIGEFDRRAVEAAKGVLILSVLLGHIRLLTAEYPLLFVIVNNFHVACFLLLPFLYDVRPINRQSLDIWFGRYLFPFVIFMLGYSVIQSFVFSNGDGLVSWLLDFLRGVFIATSVPIEQSAGMQSLWFLPALFLLVVVLGCVQRFNVPFFLVLCVALGLHGVVGYLSLETRLAIPFSAVSVFYVFVLGLFLRLVLVLFHVKHVQKYSLLFLLGWGALQICASLYTDTRIGFSKMRFQSFSDLGALLLHDGLIICATLFLLTTTYLKSSKILRYLGQYSLQIYLLHHFVYGALYTMAVKGGLISGLDYEHAVLYGLVSFPVVLVICVLIIALFKRVGVMDILFPRSTTALIERLKRKGKEA